MRMKWISTLLMLTIGVGLLSGCGKAADNNTATEATDTTSNGEDGTVTLRVWSEESNFDFMNQMIESFKQEYSGQANFDITLEESSDSEAKNNVLKDIHNAADVYPLADDQITGLVAGGALYPVPNDSEVKSANNEGAVEAATVNDVLYAYPMTADNGYFMYYNKKYFKDSDLATLDGMLEVAAKNNKKITMDWSSGWYLYSFFGNTGLDFGVNEDGVTNHCNWNAKDTAIKGVDIAKALLQISKNPGFKNGVDADLTKGAEDGSVIAGVSGAWNAATFKKIWGDNYGAVKLPTYTCNGQQVQMASFKGYKYMGVSAYSKYPEWAAKLADWFTNEQNQTLRFEQNNQGPSNTVAASSDAVSKVPALTAVAAQAEYGTLQRVGNSYWDAMTSFGDTMAQGNPKGLELQDIMNTLVEGITQSVAN